jgi:transposase
MIIVGIDIAKEKFDATIVRETGQPHHRAFANTRKGFQDFKRWLKRHGVQAARLAMEATGYYYLPLADFAVAAGYEVCVVNPHRIKAYAKSRLQRNKTDKLDAALIADFCRTQAPPAWIPPDTAMREFLALVRRFDDLTEALQQERNRLQAGIPSAAVLTTIQQHIDFLQTQLDEIRQQLHDHLDQHPDLKHQADLLRSIPGIGDITACRLLAELGDWRRFTNVRQVVAFAGLNPEHRDSGNRQGGYTAISKCGSSSLRRALYMPALVAMRCNPLLHAFQQRLRANGHRGKVLVVAVMRKLLHLAYGILKSGQPFDPQYLEKRAAIA